MEDPSAPPTALRPSNKDNLQPSSEQEVKWKSCCSYNCDSSLPSSDVCVLQGKMSGDGWEHIRSLDETENWHERNMVISKADHQAHTNWARVKQLIPLSIHHPPFLSGGSRRHGGPCEQAVSALSLYHTSIYTRPGLFPLTALTDLHRLTPHHTHLMPRPPRATAATTFAT